MHRLILALLGLAIAIAIAILGSNASHANNNSSVSATHSFGTFKTGSAVDANIIRALANESAPWLPASSGNLNSIFVAGGKLTTPIGPAASPGPTLVVN